MDLLFKSNYLALLINELHLFQFPYLPFPVSDVRDSNTGDAVLTLGHYE